MSATIAQTVGVAISKDTLDVYRHPDGVARQFTNNAKGFGALLAWLEQSQVIRVVFEPTGAYHHAFERRLSQTGLPLVKVNPLQARRFAEAVGRRAKTDAVDAQPCSPASEHSVSCRHALSSAKRLMPRRNCSPLAAPW